MQYFKTLLTVERIYELLNKYATNAQADTCVVEIENKKSLIFSDNETISAALINDSNFKPVNLSELDLISIPVIYNVLSVSGKKELFEHYINPHI